MPYGKQTPLLVTEALITKLGNQAKADKSQFILTMFPNTINDAEFAEQEKRFQVISKNQGFSYIDFTPFFTKGVDTKSLFLQYHFSSNGHRLVAEKLLPLIESISERSLTTD